MVAKEPERFKIIGKYLLLLDHSLGEGAFGNVFLAQCTDDAHKKQMNLPDLVACKIVEKNPKKTAYLESEIKTMLTCNSPNVIRLYEVCEDVDTFYLFMQYCNGGDLKDLRDLRKCFTE